MKKHVWVIMIVSLSLMVFNSEYIVSAEESDLDWSKIPIAYRLDMVLNYLNDSENTHFYDSVYTYDEKANAILSFSKLWYPYEFWTSDEEITSQAARIERITIDKCESIYREMLDYYCLDDIPLVTTFYTSDDVLLMIYINGIDCSAALLN